MKILQVVRQYLPSTGGMETYVSSLCRELSARGHRADVATLDYLFKSNRRLPAFERREGIDIIRLPSSGNARYFLAPRLLDLLPRYDLVHIHGVDFFADLLGNSRRAHGKPLVLSTHGGFFHTRWFVSFKKAYFYTITRRSLAGIDRVLASSPQDRELFARISGRVTLVENGIDYGRFAGIKDSPTGEKLVFVGRISKNKRLDRLLKTLALLRTSHPGATLTVVGPDWEGLLAGLKERAEALGVAGAVRFTGALSQQGVLKELAEARLFVSATEYEAFGLSTAEAMAAGRVPVVSDIRAFRDIVAAGTGFLADFSQPELAAEIVASVLEMPEKDLKEMGLRARERAARYGWPRVADKIAGIYEELTRSGPAGNSAACSACAAAAPANPGSQPE